MSLADELRDTLTVEPGSLRVRSRENTRLEFKQSFNLGSAGAYARTMAAFANRSGGFMVFGVSDYPRTAVGLRNDRFDRLDPARLSAYLNSHLSPQLQWQADTLEVEGVRLGFLYTFEAIDKPIIATSSARSDLRESAVYYRYAGQTTEIRYPELRALIDERLERERSAWRQHVERIASAGPTSVGVMDLVGARLYGGKAPYLIDSQLVEKLSFIREGGFTESGGNPTLRLLGDVESVDAVAPTQELPVAIHFDDIINSFLGKRGLTEAQATTFLEEALRQTTPYVPIHFFRIRAGMDTQAASELLDGLPINDRHARSMRERLEGSSVSSVGTIDHPLPQVPEDLVASLGTSETQKAARSLLVRTLQDDPESVGRNLDDLDAARVAEAITHIPEPVLKANGVPLTEILSRLFLERFDNLDAPAKTSFRKALARFDEALYRD